MIPKTVMVTSAVRMPQPPWTSGQLYPVRPAASVTFSRVLLSELHPSDFTRNAPTWPVLTF
jgi:hypothetical protein